MFRRRRAARTLADSSARVFQFLTPLRYQMTTSNTGIKMTVVAVGPGDPEFLTIKGRQALADADLVVGFKTVLDVVSAHTGDAEVRPMAYRDQEAVLDYAQEQAQQGKDCVVCVWGDLNVSAKELLNRVRRRAERVTLVPGVSSIQIACARAGISLEESTFITLHQRWDRGSELGELIELLEQGRRNVHPAAPSLRLHAAGHRRQRHRRRRRPVPSRYRVPTAVPARRTTLGRHAGPMRPTARRVQRPVHHGIPSTRRRTRLTAPWLRKHNRQPAASCW